MYGKGTGKKKPGKPSRINSGRKRRVSQSHTVTQTKRTKKGKMSVTVTQGGNTVTHKKVKDTIKDKKKLKNVTVPPRLKKQILKTLDAKQIHANGRLFFLGGYQLLTPSGTGKTSFGDQHVFPLPNSAGQGNYNTIGPGMALNQLMMHYLIARAFNGAPLATNNAPSSLTWANATTNGWFVDPTNSTKATLKFEVIEAKCYIRFKNVTKYTQHIQMYVCKPKFNRAVLTNFQTASVYEGCQALLDWNNSLDDDGASGGNAGLNNATVIGPNISQVSSYKLGQVPEHAPGFNKNWSYEKFIITLEPGQRHEHVVNGETGTYDCTKLYRQASTAVAAPASTTFFTNLSKWDREVFFVIKNDLNIGTDNGTTPVYGGGRPNQTTDQTTAVNAIAFEVEPIYKFSMPDNTGFKGTAAFSASINQSLQYRRRAYVCDYLSSIKKLVDSSADIQAKAYVDDNNPSANS